ncbi:hypothetical protein O6H91_12G009400 [Diphasiastrum complanatum]|uniref:Uncharacterized protein n=2 Tax=Diphasiastrum complanatum TaxID=34168 RepID=A0ACC2BZW9_DIPCM|nr:hypothetical protein O6H91_12G009400 [Diphasiastrum complanatum]KAJ7534902.1 hypothetical protein O6H91_12G009400 [Diphasiastrum complanatum]
MRMQSPEAPFSLIQTQTQRIEGCFGCSTIRYSKGSTMVFYFKARLKRGSMSFTWGWTSMRMKILSNTDFRKTYGNKLNNIDVVYTPWSNLNKMPTMDVGVIRFHNHRLVRTTRIEKRINDIVNRLNKTKVERTPDFKAEREVYNAAERAERKAQTREKNQRVELDRIEKEKKPKAGVTEL